MSQIWEAPLPQSASSTSLGLLSIWNFPAHPGISLGAQPQSQRSSGMNPKEQPQDFPNTPILEAQSPRTPSGTSQTPPPPRSLPRDGGRAAEHNHNPGSATRPEAGPRDSPNTPIPRAQPHSTPSGTSRTSPPPPRSAPWDGR